MREIRNRILSVIGTGSLAMQGLAGCGSAETTGWASDASGDMTAGGEMTLGDARADAQAGTGGDAVSSSEGSVAMEGDGGVNAADAMAEAGALADANPDGACACSMQGGPCGDASPCGCCSGFYCISTDGGPASQCTYTIRRPFLVGASLRSAKAVPRSDWARDISPSSAALDERTANALHRAWLDDALQEHASVAAFARFTLQMLAVGAPPELIVASQRASLDEVAHARACFALARRYGGRDVGPSSLDVHDALGRTSIVALGALTAEEGCAGETLGAALAAEQLALAEDAAVAAVLRKIAADELRHAELAWRFARWAVERGGEPAWRAIDRAVRATVAATRRIPIRDYGVDDAAWNAHGRLTCAQARRANERAIVEVVEPSLAALAATLDREPREGIALVPRLTPA
jgi:hypothetical protein